MNPHNPNSKCPKCHSGRMTVDECLHRGRGAVVGWYLLCTCKRCGDQWNEEMGIDYVKMAKLAIKQCNPNEIGFDNFNYVMNEMGFKTVDSVDMSRYWEIYVGPTHVKVSQTFGVFKILRNGAEVTHG